MYLSVIDLLLVIEDSTINEIGNNKVVEAMVGTKTTQFKIKNLVKFFLLSSNYLHRAFDLAFLSSKLDWLLVSWNKLL